MILFRGIISAVILILLWQLGVVVFSLPPYVVPSPLLILRSLQQHGGLIFTESIPTMIEAGVGFILSLFFGGFFALLLAYLRPVRLWFLPFLLISQALPVFAIAPIFLIWFGYGMASKIAVTSLMLFFPITSSFYDGLQSTPEHYLDLATTMNATKWQTLWWIRVPMALKSFSNGLRVAATFAPMGAVIGEWVGASQGLGFLILNANSRMQIDLMFAAILGLIILTLSFYYLIDLVIKRLGKGWLA